MSYNTVVSLGKVGGLNPKTELKACLEELRQLRVIDISGNGTVTVLGITANTALNHATDLYEKNQPDANENAVLDLSELVSQSPVSTKNATEYLSDTHKLTIESSRDLINQASTIGFIDSDADDDDPLLFNGYLFRRDSVEKTHKVLTSLSQDEQHKLQAFDTQLKAQGAIHIATAENLLSKSLLSKLRAAAVYDENVVSNETGDHSFITSPASFHKFSNPMLEDVFDHAKALVSALSYGASISSVARGRLWGADLLLKKLITGGTVGPVKAIGQDYRALELERVVQISRDGYGYTMRLLKKEIGEIALQVLQNSGTQNTILESIPSAQVMRYTGPEAARTKFKKKVDLQPSKSQMRTLLSSVRSEGGL